MQMRLVSAIPLFLCLAVVGCKSEPSLVGKWSGTANNQPMEMEFKADHSMKMTMTVPMGKAVVSGNYKAEGETFSMTVTGVELPGMPASVQATAKKMMEAQKGKEQAGTLKFASNDEVELTSNNVTQVLKRVK